VGSSVRCGFRCSRRSQTGRGTGPAADGARSPATSPWPDRRPGGSRFEAAAEARGGVTGPGTGILTSWPRFTLSLAVRPAAGDSASPVPEPRIAHGWARGRRAGPHDCPPGPWYVLLAPVSRRILAARSCRAFGGQQSTSAAQPPCRCSRFRDVRRRGPGGGDQLRCPSGSQTTRAHKPVGDRGRCLMGCAWWCPLGRENSGGRGGGGPDRSRSPSVPPGRSSRWRAYRMDWLSRCLRSLAVLFARV